MKHKLTTLVSLLLLLIMMSCSNNKSNFIDNGKAIISGNIINYDNHKEFKSFQLYYHKLFSLQKIKTVEIKEDGSFYVTIPCHYNMDFFIRVGRTISTLICVPNDSLILTIDADILYNPTNHYPNNTYFVKVIGGTRIKDNEFVNEFILKRNKKKLSRTEYFKIIDTYSPLEYLNYQNDIYNMEMDFLDSILRNSDGGMFSYWAKDLSKYKKTGELLKYPRRNAKANNISIDSLDIPAEYYYKTFNMGINDTKIFSFYHKHFH